MHALMGERADMETKETATILSFPTAQAYAFHISVLHGVEDFIMHVF